MGDYSVKNHTVERPRDKRPPWWKITLMKDHHDEKHPDEGPPWWKNTLMKDHHDEKTPWWETTWWKTTLMRGPPWWRKKKHLDERPPDERPPWWEATWWEVPLTKDHPDEKPPWEEASPLLKSIFLWNSFFHIFHVNESMTKEHSSFKTISSLLEIFIKGLWNELHWIAFVIKKKKNAAICENTSPSSSILASFLPYVS